MDPLTFTFATVVPAARRATAATRVRSLDAAMAAASGAPTQPVIPARQTLTCIRRFSRIDVEVALNVQRNVKGLSSRTAVRDLGGWVIRGMGQVPQPARPHPPRSLTPVRDDN